MNELPECFDDIEIGLAVLDKNGHFLKLNTFFIDLIGHTTDDLYSKHFRVITHPDDLDSNQHEFDKLSAGKIKKFCIVKRYITKHGDIVWARVIITPMSKEYFLKQVLPIENTKEQLQKSDNKIEVIESVNFDVFFKKYWWRIFQVICIGLATLSGWLINAGMKMYADSVRIDRIEKEILYKIGEKNGKQQEHDSETRNN